MESVEEMRVMPRRWATSVAMVDLPTATDPATPIQGAGAYDVFALTGNFDITERLSISGGIDNLFDRQPERYGAGQVVNGKQQIDDVKQMQKAHGGSPYSAAMSRLI